MRDFKNSFIWQFAGGFLIGAVGLIAFQPVEATRSLANRVIPQAISAAL
jgi:hypothetical protein